MPWPTWAKLNEKGLAQYALPEVANRLRLDVNRDDAFALPDGRSVVAEAIYRALIGRRDWAEPTGYCPSNVRKPPGGNSWIAPIVRSSTRSTSQSCKT